MTAYIYTPVVWEYGVLAESKFNLTLSAVQSHLIDGPSDKTKLKVRMVPDELKNGSDNGIDVLVVDVDIDVHNRTSIMYLLPDSKGFQQRQPCGGRVIYTLTYHSSLTAYVYTPLVWELKVINT